MEKKAHRFNLFDLVVILAVVAVIAFGAVKLTSNDRYSDTEKARYRVVFYTEEATDFSLARLENGKPVCDESNNIPMGTITDFTVDEQSYGQQVNSEGQYVTFPREGYGSAYITFEGEGDPYAYGAKFENGRYSVGQTVTIRAADAKFYGRIYDIQVIE